ncbi:MAG: phosphoribosylglycinamide formyltransferase [Candidatus Omnitrophica bacterium]|nr:phosphoribosylglycinamide formyltransferase [Candidatus Omnitrophota bacterium]
MQQRFAVFVSGSGTNLQAIINAVQKKAITAELALVFSNKKKVMALKRAEAAGIKTLALERKNYATNQSYERDIVIQLKEEKIDFIVLAGYMKILSPFFIKKFPNKILNVHPSLLPSFKGKQGIKDTFTYGAKVAGVTIHFVDDKMDHGPIIMQEGFKVPEDETLETLERKIHKVEYKIYPQVIQLFVQGRLKIRGRKVKILDA